MKQHIFGLAIFSFIVGAAVIIYAVLSVSEPQYISGKQTHHQVKSQSNDFAGSFIKQATIGINNEKDGLLIFEIGCVDRSKQMSLFFYNKNKNNTQLIATEEIEVKPSVGCERSTSLYKKFDWAKKINYNSNVYVIARISSEGKKFSTNFDESLAVPVLMAQGYGGFTID